jgi:hypothetical protein
MIISRGHPQKHINDKKKKIVGEKNIENGLAPKKKTETPKLK